MKQYIYSILIGVVLSFSSCADYLDVSKELADDLSKEEVFNTVALTKGWHGNIFNCITEYNQIFGVITPFNNPWCTLAGETCTNHGDIKTEMQNGFTASSAHFNRFNQLYQYIRQAYTFIDNAHSIGTPADGDTGYLSEENIARMKAEAKFFIAYSYLSLFEQYGPTPIVDYSLPDDLSSFDFPRASVDEMVGFIDGLLKELLDEDILPRTIYYDENGNKLNERNLDQMVRPTRAVVLALRAKLAVYAASKLFNGGYKEALELTNADGKKLFPAEDRSKWQTAKKRLNEFLTFADAEGMGLYIATTPTGDIDVNKSVYNLFQEYSDEIIWATGRNVMSNNQNNGEERRYRPRDLNQGFSGIGVSQQSVDAFFTKNGLTIEQDPEYNETGFSDVFNPTGTFNNTTAVNGRVDKHVCNMYANREPRFYWSITYPGKSWHILPAGKLAWQFDTSFGGNNGMGGDYIDARGCYTGYLLYKRVNNTLYPVAPGKMGWTRPGILLRMADFYLYYAEACNEVDPNDPDIIKYLDMVRRRAGIPGYQELKDNSVKDKNGNLVNIIGDYDKQAFAIRRERQVELFVEGQRYFDIRRWMICDEGEEADRTKFIGMNMIDGKLTKGAAGTPDYDVPGTFFKRTEVQQHQWKHRMYLYPIPYGEIEKSPSMIQNPGW